MRDGTKLVGGKNKTITHLRTLGKAWDDNTGGAHFDALLVEHFAEDYNKSPKRKGKPDVQGFPRSMAKLRKSAEKVSVCMEDVVFS